MQDAARAHPLQRRRTRHFGQHFVLQGAQLVDAQLRGNAGVVGE